MFEPGTQIGRYEIQRRLGRGGMGTVYAAHDPVLGRLVAIKVFAGDLEIADARERFQREARSAASLAHPHIVAVFDFGEYAAQPYIVMEYVAGETLAEVIRRKAVVSLADKLRWMEELAAGAGYAHQMSVIHRDIKPANLIIDRHGRLRILDFGIARMLGIASNTKDMIGTPGYMAPEQILGAPVDNRADLFSIGVVFYELLSYTEAFPGDTLPAITHRILTQDPVPLARLVPDLTPDVLPIIERALKKNAEERFPNAESLRTAVSRLRRRFEDDSAAVAPTILRRDTPPATANRRPGTGSVKRPARESVGVATPPPNDREALARRRSAQLEAALAQSRSLLAQGDLETAFDACQQALTYDEQHSGALELEVRIRAAFAERQAAALDDETLEPPDEDFQEITPEASAAAADYAPTVLAPPRRTPAPPPVPQRVVTPRPRLRKTVPPRKAPPPSLLARMRTAAPAVMTRLRAKVPSTAFIGGAGLAFRRAIDNADIGTAFRRAVGRLKPAHAVRKQTFVWAGIATAVVVAAIVAAIVLMPAAVPPTGTLVIDAVPWGTITAIEAENGEPQPLPSQASTPLSLTLPAGNYQVVLAGPTPDAQEQRISVRVEPNAGIVVPTVQFRALTPEEYFDQYLVVPATPDAPAADASSPALPSPVVAPPQGVAPPAAAPGVRE